MEVLLIRDIFLFNRNFLDLIKLKDLTKVIDVISSVIFSKDTQQKFQVMTQKWNSRIWVLKFNRSS